MPDGAGPLWGQSSKWEQGPWWSNKKRPNLTALRVRAMSPLVVKLLRAGWSGSFRNVTLGSTPDSRLGTTAVYQSTPKEAMAGQGTPYTKTNITITGDHS